VTAARYALGLVLACVALVPIGFGANALRVRLLPRWSGPTALLGDFTVALALILAVTQVLGSVGLFATAPVVAGLAVCGAACWYGARRTAPDAASGDAEPAPTATVVPNRYGTGGLVAAAVATVVVFAEWGSRTLVVLGHGMDTVDTLWYHMPVAARWVQDGSITDLLFLQNSSLTTYYPANIPLVHGTGILLFGSDFLSPVLNLGWLALALLAAWCIGRPFGAAPLAVAGTAVVLATPVSSGTQPGSAYSDTAGIALFLAAVAFVVTACHGRRAPRAGELAIAAAATGLAVGTKFQFLVPAAALTVGVVLLIPRGARIRRGAVWLVVLAATGAFWYVRNFIAVGSPLPDIDINLGPLHINGPEVPGLSTISDYLFERRSWSKYFLPGLDQSLGWGWWVLAVLILAGVVLGFLREPVVRLLSFVAAVSLFAVISSPAALGGPEPLWFVYVMRYSLAALTVGIVVTAVVAAGWPRWWAWTPFAGLAVVLGAIELDRTDYPEVREEQLDHPLWGVATIAALAVVALAVVAGVALARALRGRERSVQLGTVSIVVVVLLAGSFALHDRYLDGRYTSTEPLPSIFAWANDVHDERIGFIGMFSQYPLAGRDLSNYVQYVGRRAPRGAYEGLPDCRSWRTAVNSGEYSYVLTAPIGFPVVQSAAWETGWTQSDPAAHLVMREGPVSLFRLDGPLDPDGCGRPASG
jgi:hypothetical protein